MQNKILISNSSLYKMHLCLINHIIGSKKKKYEIIKIRALSLDNAGRFILDSVIMALQIIFTNLFIFKH